jgi:SNF2 family DNA or RNA helicase
LWNSHFPFLEHNTDRLNTLVKGILLRRTKNQVDAITNKKLIDLPTRNYNVVRLEMEGLEDRIYQLMFEASR